MCVGYYERKINYMWLNAPQKVLLLPGNESMSGVDETMNDINVNAISESSIQLLQIHPFPHQLPILKKMYSNWIAIGSKRAPLPRIK